MTPLHSAQGCQLISSNIHDLCKYICRYATTKISCADCNITTNLYSHHNSTPEWCALSAVWCGLLVGLEWWVQHGVYTMGEHEYFKTYKFIFSHSRFAAFCYLPSSASIIHTHRIYYDWWQLLKSCNKSCSRVGCRSTCYIIQNIWHYLRNCHSKDWTSSFYLSNAHNGTWLRTVCCERRVCLFSSPSIMRGGDLLWPNSSRNVRTNCHSWEFLCCDTVQDMDDLFQPLSLCFGVKGRCSDAVMCLRAMDEASKNHPWMMSRNSMDWSCTTRRSFCIRTWAVGITTLTHNTTRYVRLGSIWRAGLK